MKTSYIFLEMLKFVVTKATLIWVGKSWTTAIVSTKLSFMLILKSEENWIDTLKTWLSVKNPHFLFYSRETLKKWSPHDMINFTQFHEDITKMSISTYVFLFPIDFFSYLNNQIFCHKTYIHITWLFTKSSYCSFSRKQLKKIRM